MSDVFIPDFRSCGIREGGVSISIFLSIIANACSLPKGVKALPVPRKSMRFIVTDYASKT